MSTINIGWLNGTVSGTSTNMYAYSHAQITFVGNPENGVTVADELLSVSVSQTSGTKIATLTKGNGTAYDLYAPVASGADYAEYFEWADGNTNNEDRVGLFVTLDSGNKIRVASELDTYILGVISGSPAVLGNDDGTEWSNKYLKDAFGREILSESGERIINPDFDDSKEYISRKERNEWDPVGMLGVLTVYQDGSAKVNGYVKVGKDGKAKDVGDFSCVYGSYRVIEVVSDSIIKIVFK